MSQDISLNGLYGLIDVKIAQKLGYLQIVKVYWNVLLIALWSLDYH